MSDGDVSVTFSTRKGSVSFVRSKKPLGILTRVSLNVSDQYLKSDVVVQRNGKTMLQQHLSVNCK